jgi:RNA polymerase sigma-70 factor (ECF subfamily)
LLEIQTLVERCRQGDELAWEALVRRFQRRVYAVAWNYMRNEDAARDMAQEVFIRVYRQLRKFKVEKSFLPWLLSVTRNACIDRLRRRKARPPAQDVPVEEGVPVAAAGPTPEEEVETQWRKRLLYRALSRMSDSDREIIMLKDIQGLKLEEIAGMLALPLGTVKSRSNRARVALASRLRMLDPRFGT